MQITSTLSLRLLAERAPTLTTPHQLTALRHLLVTAYPNAQLTALSDADLQPLILESQSA